ncbi:carbohydrate ABC transporter membrane protein 2, CUT1 family (TC 3.A.1.1.-) [Marinactinospora thermotolerans DSM 45154]|uniref:Carbohydrate ABC transporter membrane protein 2, CUT1 family (TC 3.A.1.1.-) n=1 Tax=Marinactinospora thermotolerans DSM 45154 TaxID=1122192 RepID=A0A1T4LQX5_9ACTN|nr:carbohydrate ABC transporter permease [Marinactinospora thermotolerans]SJZ57142.1 carbohydrate ABC transporter membrane protein 2, CUT1 family (TC 3.A.1.1.-) [Marinactinospora thermotolerans DSM 45154]
MSAPTATLRPSRGATEGSRPRPRITAGGAMVTVSALVLAVVWLIPLVWAVLTSLKPEGETTAVPIRWLPLEPTLEAYRLVLARGDLQRWLVNSTVISTVVTVLTLMVCVLAAYAFSKTRFPGRRALFALFLAGILVPPQVLIVPLFDEMTFLGLVDTYWGVALPQVVAPVMVFILKRFFDAIPRDYEEAARLDGAGHPRILWSVVLPMSGPILAAVAIFTFVQSWNNFLWPFIAATDPALMTVPVGLGSVQGAYGIQYAQNMAAAVLGALPLLVVFLLFQRQVVRGVTDAGLK